MPSPDINDSTIIPVRSLNGRLILQTYKKEAAKTAIRGGIATIEQKTVLKGLKVLVPAKLASGETIPAGSIAYIKEETLHNSVSTWAKTYECPAVSEPFIICDISLVEILECK